MALESRSAPLLLLFVLSCWCGATAARPAPAFSSAAPGAAGFVKSWCAGTEYPALCDATLAPYAVTPRPRCAGTEYPALCDATLAPYAPEVGTSPARLSWAALTVTLGGARDAAAAMKGMAAAGGLAAEAARDCVSMLGDAVGMLRQSVEAMARLGEEGQAAAAGTGSGGGSRNVRFQVDSVQTWASAALTDDDMCMEGFKGEAAVVREAVQGHVVGVAHLTANALAIVNAMAKPMGVDICRGSCQFTPTPPPTATP